MAADETVSVLFRVRQIGRFIRDTQRARDSIRRMDKETSALGRTSRKAHAQMSNGWNKVRRSALAVRSAYLAVGFVGGYALLGLAKSTIDFEKTMRQAAAVMSNDGVVSAKEYQAAMQGVSAAAARTKFSQQEAAEGFLTLAQAGFKGQRAVDLLNNSLDLAAAAGTDVATGADVMTSIMTIFEDKAGSATHVADLMTRALNASKLNLDDLRYSMKYAAPVAEGLGISVEDLTTTIAVLAQAGIRGTTAGTSLRSGLTRLVGPTKAVKKGLRELGLEAKDLVDAKGKLRSIPDLLEIFNERSKGISSAKRTAAFKDIFGLYASPAWNQLINKGPKAWAKMNAQVVGNTSITAKKVAAEANKTIGGALERMVGNIQNVFNVWILGHTEDIQAFINMITGWINDLITPGTMAYKIVGLLGDALMDVAGIVGSVAQMALPVFIAGVGTLYPLLKATAWILDTLNGILKPMIPYVQVLVAMWVGWKLAMMAFNAVVLVGGRALTILKWAIFGLKNPLLVATLGMDALNAAFLANPVGLTIAALVAIGIGFVILYKKVAWFRNLVNAVWAWIKGHWPLLIAIFAGPIAVVALLVRAFRPLMGFFQTLWSAIAQAFQRAWEVIEPIVSKIIAAIDKITGFFASGNSDRANAQARAFQNFGAPSPYANIPTNATGGRISGGGLSWVGERGPELLSLPSGSRVVPFRPASVEAGSSGGGGGSPFGPIHTHVHLNGREIATAVHSYAKDKDARR